MEEGSLHVENPKDHLMRHRFRKAAAVGLVTGLMGVVLSVIPAGRSIEEDFGLHLLFKMRGTREVPRDVLIVSMDTESAQNLSLLSKPERWPRSLHASVVQTLLHEGAKAIVFDMFFEEPKSAEEDVPFAAAMKEARNVVLCQSLRQESLTLVKGERERTFSVNIERLVPPLPLFAESAIGAAPFPLPKVPVKVSKYWTFKTEAGDKPTLPVVAFQVYALEVYREFLSLLSIFSPEDGSRLPQDGESILQDGNIVKLALSIREIFLRQPDLATSMLAELDRVPSITLSQEHLRLLKALINMYRSPDSLYLNYYGPPGHIETVPYHVILQGRNSSRTSHPWPEVRGKAAFIGLSQLLRPEQRDGFYTAFSQPTGIDMSGVEIAATAFANLLEGQHVKPLSPGGRVCLVFAWGILLSTVCWSVSTLAAALLMILAGSAYLTLAYREFCASAVWLPIMIPFVAQVPMAFFGVLWWKYIDTHREREIIRRAFGYYVPDKVVDEISKGVGDFLVAGKTVYGTCLCTDAEQYVRLSEAMCPEDLRDYMNRYYEAIFKPVRQHGGIVSDVVGDSMMAIWATAHPDSALRFEACRAALEISEAVRRFNDSEGNRPYELPTRMGLHSGHISIGSIGGVDHYEYRAVGDVVNTASRIESLNKLLKTRVLVSEEVIEGLDGFLSRGLGRFVLAGKSKPVIIHELIGLEREAGEEQTRLCEVFAAAMEAYLQTSWDEAAALFHRCLEISAHDGPSRFFLLQCKEYRGRPPDVDWNGAYIVTRK